MIYYRKNEKPENSEMHGISTSKKIMNKTNG